LEYETVKVSEGIYKFRLTPRYRFGYVGVYVDLNWCIFISKDDIPGEVPNKTILEKDMNDLEKMLLNMNKLEIINLIKSKEKIKKFNL